MCRGHCGSESSASFAFALHSQGAAGEGVSAFVVARGWCRGRVKRSKGDPSGAVTVLVLVQLAATGRCLAGDSAPSIDLFGASSRSIAALFWEVSELLK